MFRGGHYNSRKRVSLWVRAIRIGHPWAGFKKNPAISVLPSINAEAFGSYYAVPCCIIAVTGIGSNKLLIKENISTSLTLKNISLLQQRSILFKKNYIITCIHNLHMVIESYLIKFFLILKKKNKIKLDCVIEQKAALYLISPRYPKCVSVFKDVVQGVPSRCNG
ncbi:hypothetical protein ALC56_13364 [Trachymyrmex septentrionalis]|uniref:Uncharacterized protein n=1 Tax=Trachymyrmex septentrionalis TaxID=34720 RepID=A0A195EWI0_9HYME|nr:hypothetical protein ALC56_13364 [Trachymyrmex septentrionalis]